MKFVIIGGGVAGVCCAEELCRLCPADEVVLVSADRTLKASWLHGDAGMRFGYCMHAMFVTLVVNMLWCAPLSWQGATVVCRLTQTIEEIQGAQPIGSS